MGEITGTGRKLRHFRCWSANLRISVVSQVAVDAKSRLRRIQEPNRQTQPQHDSRNRQNVSDSTAPLSGCTSFWWHKQPRRLWGDTLLNDYDSECSPVWLYTQLFSRNRPEDVIFLLGVSHKTWIQTFPVRSEESLITINPLNPTVRFCCFVFWIYETLSPLLLCCSFSFACPH